MATSSVFDLTRFTALAAGDVIPCVDISDTAQSAHGSLDSITVTNFFASIPVPIIYTGSSVNALAVGPTGATAPVLLVNATTLRVGIGTASPLAPLHVGAQAVNNSVDAVILLSRAVNDTVVGNGHAFSDSSAVTRSGTIGYASYDARITVTGANNYDHYAAFQCLATLNFSGTMTNFYAFSAKASVTAGTITNFYGHYTFNPTQSGPVTNLYGIYVEGLTRGGTLNHAIYTNAGTVSLGDSLVIRSGGITLTTSISSVTALATPSAYAATTATFFASTVSGATVMGYGTTADVTLKNRAGSNALVVPSNTLAVVAAGADLMTFFATATITPDAGTIYGGGTSVVTPVQGIRIGNAGGVFAYRINGTAAAPTVPVANDVLGIVGTGGFNGTTLVNGPQIRGIATETWSGTARGSKLSLDVRPNTTTTQTPALTLDQDTSATFAASLVVTTGFGCNSKTAQTAFASGGALNAYGAGANGLDSGANMSALHAMVVAIRAALVANGVMS